MHASTTWRQRIDRRIDHKMVILSHADEIGRRPQMFWRISGCDNDRGRTALGLARIDRRLSILPADAYRHSDAHGAENRQRRCDTPPKSIHHILP